MTCIYRGTMDWISRMHGFFTDHLEEQCWCDGAERSSQAHPYNFLYILTSDSKW